MNIFAFVEINDAVSLLLLSLIAHKPRKTVYCFLLKIDITETNITVGVIIYSTTCCKLLAYDNKCHITKQTLLKKHA